jgi:hypothetical protein
MWSRHVKLFDLGDYERSKAGLEFPRMKSYRPDVKLAKQFYSLRLRMERMRRGKAEPAKRIPSNSEPWIENPRTLEDVEAIIDGIAETLKQLKRAEK